MSLLGDIKTFIENAISPTNAFVSTSTADNLFVQGYSFSSRDVLTVQPDVTEITYIHFDPRTASNKQIVFEPLRFVGAEAGPVLIDLFVGPTLTAGGRTPLIVTNRRSTSGNVAETVLETVLAVNVSDPGTRFSGRLLPTASGGGSSPNIGGESAGDLPFEIDPTKDYLIKISNKNGANSLVEYNATWFEVPLPT